MPFHILGIWFRGLLAIGILAGGIGLLKRGYDDSHVIVPVRAVPTGGRERDEAARDGREPASVPGRRVFRLEPGLNRETAELAAGTALLVWALLGRWVRQAGAAVLGGGGSRSAEGSAADEPRAERTGEVHWIARPDGSRLRVECYGPPDAPPLVMTHGWGANSTEWFYPKKSLADRFRLIVWDEPGLGLSRKPENNDYRLETLAADLEAVLTLAGDRPAVLVGHSIGGMISLTFCKVFPDSLGRRVAGLVLAHTSYTNPVRTTKHAAFYTAIERPILIPLLHLTIALWPLVWVMTWLSYLNGSAHRSTHRESFAGTETRGQLDFFTRFMPHARPDVLARGMLGMIAYDATAVLSAISVPTLVVIGDRDITTLPEAGRFISQGVPDAQLATLAPARHLGLVEHHGQFDELVARFAETCLATGVSR